MRKNIIKGAFYAIFPILFNVMFFVLGGAHHPASVWISYAWIHLAYLIMISTSFFIRKTQSAVIFAFTTAQISTIYFILEFIIGLIFIFVASDGIKAPIIVQLIPFCIFMLVFLWNMLHNEHTADNEARRSAEISFIKTSSSKAKLLMDMTNDSAMKNSIEKVYDLLHSSPSRSCAAAKEIESSIMMMLSELGDFLDENNVEEANKLVRKIRYAAEERNRIVSLAN